MTENKKKLVNIDDIYDDKALACKQNELNILLNHEPKKAWVKQHPIAKKEVYEDGRKVRVPIDYLPIERVEYLLTVIYTDWNVEIKETQLLANSIVMTVTLHYKDPVTGLMKVQDGTGASPLQTDRDASATDWTKIKTSAVMMAAPAAKSFAVKDAAEQLGKLFGKDLNRADKIAYDSLNDKFAAPLDMALEIRKVIELIDKLPEESQSLYKDMLKAKKESGEISIKIIQEIKKQVESEIS